MAIFRKGVIGCVGPATKLFSEVEGNGEVRMTTITSAITINEEKRQKIMHVFISET